MNFVEFVREIYMSILCYGIRQSIHGPSKRQFSLRSRDTLSLFCKSVERILCHEMLVFDDYNLSNVKLYLISAFYP